MIAWNWNEGKNRRLRRTRNISFEDVADVIESGNALDIVINPAYNGQKIFIVKFNDYTSAVPYETDQRDGIILKTTYPSRKYHKMYGLNS